MNKINQHEKTTIAEHAMQRPLLWAEQGYAVLPIMPNEKCPYNAKLIAAVLGIESPGTGNGGVHLATTDRQIIQRLWSVFPDARVGVATGRRSNQVIVLDIDRKNGKDGLDSLKNLGLAMPDTVWQQTPSGGYHFLYRAQPNDRLPTDAGRIGEGLDRRGDNGYIIDYGTIDPTCPLTQAPEWLLAGGHDALSRYELGDPSLAAPSLADANKALEAIDPNDLNRDEWIKITAAYKQATYNFDNLNARILWNKWCARYDANDQHENNKQWDSIKSTSSGWNTLLNNSPAKPEFLFNNADIHIPKAVIAKDFEQLMAEVEGLYNDTDVAIVEKMCSEASNLSPLKKDKILRAISNNTGIAVTTLRKQMVESNEGNEPDHHKLALKTIDDFGKENLVYADQFTWKFANTGVWKRCDDRQLKQRTQATLSASNLTITSTRVSGIVDVLKSEIYKNDHQFNIGSVESLNCLNGELEPYNGMWLLHEHKRENYRTTQIPVRYDPNAQAPLFYDFLNNIFRDDHDKQQKIQVILEMMGYSLMSHANREKFILLIGAGANGKSVLLATLEELLGKENVAGVQPSNFNSTFQRAHLHQKLANIVTELKQGEIIADAELKAITSGEPATVEHKNQNPFVMRPFATCWFGTNHMPHTRDYSDAFFRRAIVVTFNRVFTQSEQDTHLKNKLKTELAGILNLALWGYTQVIRNNGFTIPDSSREAEFRWRLEANQVAQFVDACCLSGAQYNTPIDQLYNHYRIWSQTAGIKQQLGKISFGERLCALGFSRNKSTGGVRAIAGITLNGQMF